MLIKIGLIKVVYNYNPAIPTMAVASQKGQESNSGSFHEAGHLGWSSVEIGTTKK